MAKILILKISIDFNVSKGPESPEQFFEKCLSVCMYEWYSVKTSAKLTRLVLFAFFGNID